MARSFIIKVEKESNYEKKQRVQLGLMTPLLRDKTLWKWSDNQECLQCHIGEFRAEIRPSGFTESYDIGIWMNDYEKKYPIKVMHMREEDGVKRITRCATHIVDENTRETILSFPLKEFAESMRSKRPPIASKTESEQEQEVLRLSVR